MPKFEMDFRRDWVEVMKARLRKLGYSPGPNDDPRHIGMVYANAILRRIDLHPRSVAESRDIVVPANLRDGYDWFVEKAKRGEDLNPHLSKGIGRPEEPDSLFNDWGIHHFHLGRVLDASGFVERTGPLLFAYVTKTHAYLINVLLHRDWSNQRLVQCLHENWPEAIAHRCLRGFTTVEPVPTDQHVEQFRKAGVTVCLTMPDGTIYTPIGGGYSTDGASLRAFVESDRAFFECDRLEEFVRSNIEDLIMQLRAKRLSVPDTFCFQLVFKDGEIYAFDRQAKLAWNLPKLSL